MVASSERSYGPSSSPWRRLPDERHLHEACVQYGLALDPPPDPLAWRRVGDPLARLRHGLTELYAYFRRNESLLRNVARDVPLVLPRYGGQLPEALAGFLALPDQLRDALADGWQPAASSAPALRAVLGLAVDFSVWHTLVRRQGLDEAQALDLMVHLVACASTLASDNIAGACSVSATGAV